MSSKEAKPGKKIELAKKERGGKGKVNEELNRATASTTVEELLREDTSEGGGKAGAENTPEANKIQEIDPLDRGTEYFYDCLFGDKQFDAAEFGKIILEIEARGKVNDFISECVGEAMSGRSFIEKPESVDRLREFLKKLNQSAKDVKVDIESAVKKGLSTGIREKIITNISYFSLAEGKNVSEGIRNVLNLAKEIGMDSKQLLVDGVAGLFKKEARGGGAFSVISAQKMWNGVLKGVCEENGVDLLKEENTRDALVDLFYSALRGNFYSFNRFYETFGSVDEWLDKRVVLEIAKEKVPQHFAEWTKKRKDPNPRHFRRGGGVDVGNWEKQQGVDFLKIVQKLGIELPQTDDLNPDKWLEK